MTCFPIPRKKKSSFHYFLVEGKDRLMFILFSFAATTGISYAYSLELIFLYVKPFLVFEKPFIFTELTEALYITIKLCVVAGLHGMLPFACYQAWCFLVPSCYYHERRRWSTILTLVNLLAAVGWLGVYLIVLPTLSAVLLQFEINNPLLTVQLEARISSYIEWSSQVFLALILACQLPLLSYLAFQVGAFNPKIMSENRRAVGIASLVIAGVLSPPDLLAQWLTTIFLFLCFEFLLWLGMVFKQVLPPPPSSFGSKAKGVPTPE